MFAWGFGFWMWRLTLACVVLFLMTAEYSAVMCGAWPGTLVTWPWLRFSMIYCCALRLWSQIILTASSLRPLRPWCQFVLDDLWNAVVCFQPPRLLIGKVWVPVMHFCACLIQCRVDRRLGSCRLISVQPLIGSSIWAFSISSALWVLEVLSRLYWHSFYQTDHSKLWWMVVEVNWLTLYQECLRAVFWARYCSSCTLRNSFPFFKVNWSVMLMTPLWWLLCHPQASELQ